MAPMAVPVLLMNEIGVPSWGEHTTDLFQRLFVKFGNNRMLFVKYAQ